MLYTALAVYRLCLSVLVQKARQPRWVIANEQMHASPIALQQQIDFVSEAACGCSG